AVFQRQRFPHPQVAQGRRTHRPYLRHQFLGRALERAVDASRPAGALSAPPLLEVDNLSVAFATPHGERPAVADVSFALSAGRPLGMVGESGCGKTMTALSIVRQVPRPARVGGSIRFEGTELAPLDDAAMRQLLGDRLAMVFQEPMTS